MVSAHTERLLKGPLWTRRAQTMTRASQGGLIGSVTGRWWEGKTKKKRDGGFFILLKSVKYFDMSHTPWCSSSWAFCLSAGKTIDFLRDQVVRLPASRQNLSWGAMACRCSCSAGVLPMDTGDKKPFEGATSVVWPCRFLFSWLTRNFLVVFSFLFFVGLRFDLVWSFCLC